jgi:uridine kinase
MKKPYIVGITGGSASGKTLFLKSLMTHFSDEEICLISQDNYYKSIDLVPRDQNGVENFDLPEAIDFKLYAQHILALSNGETIKTPEYNFNNPKAEINYIVYKPAPIIVVEGIFVLTDETVSSMLDLKVFIDAKEYIKIKRRINRDNKERGYDLADVLYRWENHVAPTYEAYIKPTKASADLIINNNSQFKQGLEILSHFLKTKI